MKVATSASPRPFSPQLGLAAVLVIVGLALPASTLVQFLRPDAGALLPSLLLGATLFRVGLVGLGVAVLVVDRLVRWTGRTETIATTVPGTAERVALAVILLAALALRLYRLDSGLWYDEIMTYVHYVNMPVGDIVTTFDSQNQHFLFSLLAHASVSLFGVSAWALRLPAALFGVGSIWAVYLLGREVGTAREGLLAAGLLTVSYQHVWFSQNARGYSGLLFWTLLSSWLLFRALRVGQPRLWLLYALTAALGVYTHMTMLFVVFGQGVAYLVTLYTRRRSVWSDRWTGLALGFGGAGLLTLQLHALVLPQFMSGTVGEQSTVALWNNPLWTLMELTRAVQISFAGGVIALAGLAVFGAGLLDFARREPVVAVLTLVPILVCSAVTLGLGHPLWPRFFFFAVGFAALVVVRGAMVMGRAARRVGLPTRWAIWLGPALCLALIAVAARSLPFAYGPKQDYADALAFVEAHRQPGDVVATVGLAGDPYQMYYQVDWPRVESVDQLAALRTQANHTWVLYTLPLEARSVYPEVMAVVERDFEVVQQFYGTAGDGTIFVCRAGGGSSS